MFTASLGIFLFGVILALAGGAIGASIGGNYAFVLTGFSVIFSWGVFAFTGSTFAFDYIAFGPFMGPHIAFAGGAAGAIYAAYRGYMKDGKDVNSPLAGLGRPDVLLVGAAFGVLGYLLQIGIAMIPWFGGHTDSVALTVLLSGMTARVAFGGTRLFSGSLHDAHKFEEGKRGLAKIAPGTNGRWLEWQEKPGQVITIGSFFGAAAGGVSLFLAGNVGARLTELGMDGSLAAALANTFPFAISAVIILFLITNRSMPVQHHVTNIGGLATIQFFPILMGSTFATFQWTATSTWDSRTWMLAIVAVLIGGVFGVVAACFGELAARLWYNRGTSHIDPPAGAIWICNTIVVSLAALLA
ncbi:hypothetical protein NSA19_05960 [Actinomyces bowdenii]|uniref:hypothetical protein n=1 Tax=Actinomyces bowdenii TaxID=131109 RepID=UPI00214BCB8A|nr:hypothetical protein [Actinomyces bowdenii]MCR2052396.1 hypothetical protein [Actinomyces bowdenii]MDO5063871.1 hypothetical protein [Actinomyces bowdenii]